MRFITHPGRRNPNKFKEIAADPVLQTKDLFLCSEDAWYFISGYCTTNDELDPDNPYKPFPDKEYLKIACKYILTHDRLIIIKSRQIMISWLLSAIMLWEVLFKEGYKCYFRLINATKTDSKIKDRIYLMWSKLPDHIKNAIRVNPTNRGKHLEGLFVNDSIGSQIISLPQGEDKILGESATRINEDDCGINPGLESDFEKNEPCGLNITYTGTASNNPFWKKIAGRPLVHRWKLISGVYTWRYFPNQEDKSRGYTVLEIFFWSDPDKSPRTQVGKAWIEKEKARSTKACWEREYMINWDFVGEEGIAPEFKQNYQNYIGAVDYNPDAPVLRGWDFGFSPSPTVIKFAQYNALGQLGVMFSIIIYGMKIETVLTNILTLSYQLFPQTSPEDFYDFPDPHEKVATHYIGKSILELMMEKGLNPQVKESGVLKLTGNKKKAIVYTILANNKNGVPGLRIDPGGCKLQLKNDKGEPVIITASNTVLIECLTDKITVEEKDTGNLAIIGEHPWKDDFDTFCYMIEMSQSELGVPDANLLPGYSIWE